MDLTLPRFCRAYLEWKRRELRGTRDAESTWQRLMALVNTPPRAVRLARSARAVPSVAAHPVIERRNEAAAFEAFAGFNPRKA